MSLTSNLLFFGAGYYVGSNFNTLISVTETGIKVANFDLVKAEKTKYVIANVYEIKKI